MILNETFDLLKTRYESQFSTTTIKRLHIGPFFAALQLSSGFCGLTSVEQSNLSCCARTRSRENTPFSPGNISGKKLLDLFSWPAESELLNIVKLAAINAVSQELISTSDYTIIEDKDPIELVDLNNSKTICVVGAFDSYMRKIANSSSKLIVLELNEPAVPDEFKQYYSPAANASSVFPEADVIIITGSTLVNNTLDHILEIIPPNKQVIIVGPTAGLIPDVLFQHGIQIIGATRVVDADRLFRAIAEGAAGYHLFINGAQKICLLNNVAGGR